MLTIINIRNEAKTLSVPESFVGTKYKNMMTNSDITLNATLEMSAYQYYILQKK
jgi:hypothetical protein